MAFGLYAWHGISFSTPSAMIPSLQCYSSSRITTTDVLEKCPEFAYADNNEIHEKTG
jgi:hypothetical protein